MKRRVIISFIYAVLLLVSCQTVGKYSFEEVTFVSSFDGEVRVSPENSKTVELNLDGIQGIKIYGPYIIVSSESEEGLISIFEKKAPYRKLGSFFKKGNGPGELIYPFLPGGFNYYTSENGTIYADINNRAGKLIRFNISESIEEGKTVSEVIGTAEKTSFDVIDLGDDGIFYKTMSPERDRQIRFVEKDGQTYSTKGMTILNSARIKNKNDEVLNSFTDTIANYENFYKDLLKIFLLFKKNTQITKNEIYIFRNSTELMIRLQEYAKENKQPEWMQYIKRIIFDEEINIILSLEAANCLLDLNLSSFKGHEKYQNIKSEFSEKEINSNLIDKHYLNSIIIKTGVNNNCKELLIGKLYLIVSAQSNRKMIIDILMKLSRLDKEKFLNILENTFKLEGNLSNSLKLFSDFWQLLNEYYSENLLFVNGECLFQMLDYLDCENPLLRHLSKSWLDQSIKQFKKIVDPILKRLIDPNIIVNENYLVEKESDTKKIIHSYKALKSLILNSSIIKFFIENNPNDEILQICEKIRLFSLNILEKNYIYILIEISLRFIRAKIKEDLKESLQKDNLSINSSSCQFLEFLLSHINNTEIIMQYENN